MNIEQIKEKYNNQQQFKMDLISVLRTFKREGIDNFVVLRKENLDAIMSELDKKDKIIDEMAEEYSLIIDTDVLGICACCSYNNEDCHGDYCKEALINHFTKKVEG